MQYENKSGGDDATFLPWARETEFVADPSRRDFPVVRFVGADEYNSQHHRMVAILDALHDELCPRELRKQLADPAADPLEVVNQYFLWIDDIEKVLLFWCEDDGVLVSQGTFTYAFSSYGLKHVAEAWLQSNLKSGVPDLRADLLEHVDILERVREKGGAA
jgi:hypothetical protein